MLSLRFLVPVFLIAVLLVGTAAGQTTSDAAAFKYVLPVKGRYINDHDLLRGPDSLWHLFSIIGRVSGERWDRDGNEVMIAHFTSDDLIEWKEQRPAVRIGEEGSYDDSHVYAPSVIERDGTFYMFYTATEGSHPSPEHICMATSTDLYTWEKPAGNPVFTPDPTWAAYHSPMRAGGAGPISCRDPHIIPHPRYGYIMYYVARLRESKESSDLACVAAAVSTDLVRWEDKGPILIRKAMGQEDYVWSHPESPCVVDYLGRYYLFWKGGNGINYAISDDPLDFQYVNSYFLTTAHASEIVSHGGNWYITSCSRDPKDSKHQTDRQRGFYIAALGWDGRWPFVFPIDSTER